jgi:hypothetical protein
VFKWETHSDRYTKWADILTFENIALQGGEPYLNPELKIWATNIKNLFPATPRLSVSTNGTLLKHNIELSQELIEMGWDLVISCHHSSHRATIDDSIDKILSKWNNIRLEEYREDKDKYSYSDHLVRKYWHNDKVLIELHEWDSFFPAPQIVKDGVISFEWGDANLNHERCMAIPCSMMMHGIYYKCSLLSSYKEASLQFKFEEDALKLLEEYKGCDPFDTEDEIRTFFANLNKVVPQCKLCKYYEENHPQKDYRLIPLHPDNTKVKLQKP